MESSSTTHPLSLIPAHIEDMSIPEKLRAVMKVGADMTDLYSGVAGDLMNINPDGPEFEWRSIAEIAIAAVSRLNNVIGNALETVSGASAGPMQGMSRSANTVGADSPMEEVEAIDQQLRLSEGGEIQEDEDQPMSASTETARLPSPEMPQELTDFAGTVEETKTRASRNETVDWGRYIKAVRPYMGLVPGHVLMRAKNAKVQRLANDVLHLHERILVISPSSANLGKSTLDRYLREAWEEDSLIMRLYRLGDDDASGDDDTPGDGDT